MNEPGIDNPGCVRVVRLIQAGTASDEDLLFLWRQTVDYLHKGIKSRSNMSQHDPSMAVEDLEQELFIRVPKWAMTFPDAMDSWPRWIRSCWYRWILNFSSYHGRRRPRNWVSDSVDTEDGTTLAECIPDPNAHEPGEESPAQNLLEDVIEIMKGYQTGATPAWQLASRRYMAFRIVVGLPIEQSAALANPAWSPEYYRKMELQILGMYDPTMGRRDAKGNCTARKKPNPGI